MARGIGGGASTGPRPDAWQEEAGALLLKTKGRRCVNGNLH